MELRLYINDELIDIDESVIAPLTYSIADVKSPNMRSRNRSKTIKLKGTQNNLRAMFPAYNISLQSPDSGFDFNPNGELPVKILRNGVNIFSGVANFIQTTRSKGTYFFEFQIFGKSIGLFEQLGDKTLSELDWSEYDHALTISNVRLSQDTSVVQNGSPVSNFTAGNPDGFGYLYPLANWGYANNQTTPKTNELVPLFYVKEALEKCFAIGGYTITGNFINATTIKKIVFGWGGGDRVLLSSAEQSARECSYDGSSGSIAESFSYTLYNPTPYPNRAVYYFQKDYRLGDISPLSTVVVTDTLSQYDEVTGTLTIAKTGTYNIFYDFDTTINSMGFTGGSYSGSQQKCQFRVTVYVNGFPRFSYTNQFISAGSEAVSGNYQYNLQTGDQIYFEVRLFNISVYADNTTAQNAPTFDVDWQVDNLNFEVTALEVALTEGDTVQMSRWMPKIKCRDFVNSIITMANLYLSEPDDEGNVRIESFDSYYNTTNNADNWTMKLDHSKDMVIKTSAGIDGKLYRFKFAEDRDAYKQYYYDKWGHDYGDYDYNVPTTFKKGEKVYDVLFAQTVPIDVGSLVIPQIVNKDATTGVITPYKGKPRIFIYNGLQTGAWTLKNSLTGAGTAYATYPQIHHVNDVAKPTLDLNFGVPVEIYYTTSNYTSKNLFTSYYFRLINELTSPDSKFIEAYFKLNEEDLQGEFMRDLVNINGSVFRKNVISDFDATGFETTRVELIKVLDSDAFTPFAIGMDDFAQTNTARMISNTPQPATDTASSDKTVNTITAANWEVDTSGGDVIMTIEIDAPAGYTWDFKKTNAYNTLTVIGETDLSGTPYPIDGSTTGATIVALHDSLTIRKNEDDSFSII